jgi:hypothetical protein
VKHHNSGTDAKVKLRRMMLQQLALPSYRVLELYGGPGEMRRAAWHDAVEAVSIDADINSEATYLGDSIATARHLDVSRFDVFDIDPFANPWHGLYTVSRCVQPTGRRIGVCLTDGAGGGAASMKSELRLYGWGQQVFDALDLKPADHPKDTITGQRRFEATARRLLVGLTGWRLDWFAASWGGGKDGRHGGCFYGVAVLVTP